MAKKMYELIGKPVASDETTDTSKRVAESDCDQWLVGLSSSTAGQKVLDHLNHIEASPHMRSSSAFEQVTTFRRIFMHALSKTSTPFGLPKKFPKYIIIVNFSGERLLLYTSNSTLISLLTLDASGVNESSYDGVEQIIAKADTTDGTSVLLCYSLPFQLGIESLYWECKLLTRQGKKYIDNDLACNVWDRHACTSTSSKDCEGQFHEILDAQVDAFQNNMCAFDLDVKIEQIDGIQPEEVTDSKNAKLMSMVSMLQNERRKMIEEHKQEKDDIRVACAKEIENNCNTLQASFEKQVSDDTRTSECISKLEIELAEKERRFQELKSEDMIKAETIENMKRCHEEKLKELSKENQSLIAQIRKVESDKTSALKKQEVVHQQLHDEAERKLQHARQSEAFANESINQIKIIESAFDGVSSEKEFLESKLKDMNKQLICSRLRLAFQLRSNEKLSKMTREARMNHVECNEEVKSLQVEVNTMSETCENYKEEAESLRDKVAALESELRNVSLDTAQDSVQAHTERLDSQVQTDILPESLKIGELESESVKLKDEIVQLKFELGKAKSKNNKKTSPCNVITDHSEQPPYTPDGVLEGTIQQLHLSLNTLTDLARQCKTHEQSAMEAWSKVHAYENMGASAMQHAGQYPMPFMYMPPHAHTHHPPMPPHFP